ARVGPDRRGAGGDAGDRQPSSRPGRAPRLRRPPSRRARAGSRHRSPWTRSARPAALRPPSLGATTRRRPPRPLSATAAIASPARGRAGSGAGRGRSRGDRALRGLPADALLLGVPPAGGGRPPSLTEEVANRDPGSIGAGADPASGRCGPFSLFSAPGALHQGSP